MFGKSKQMKRPLTVAILFFAFIVTPFFSISQHWRHTGRWHYDTGLGLRFGTPVSISYKKNFHSNSDGIELALGTPTKWLRVNFGGVNVGTPSGISFLAAYHFQHDLGSYGGLIIYYGPTAVISLWKKFSGSSQPYLDIGANLGAEYSFDPLPIAVFVDFVPVFEVFQDAGTWWSYSGFGLRYNWR